MTVVFCTHCSIMETVESPNSQMTGHFLRLLFIHNYIPVVDKLLQHENLVMSLATPQGVVVLEHFVNWLFGVAKMSINSFHNAHIGRLYPPEYLEATGYQLHELAWNWLREHEAPKEIIDAVSLSTVLVQYAGFMKENNICDALLDSIPVDIACSIQLIKLLGGKYLDGAGTIEFENKVEWVTK